jgi:hypothetical protein
MASTDQDTLLVGVYYTSEQAAKAYDALRRDGFRDDQLRVSLCAAHLNAEARTPRLAAPGPTPPVRWAVGALGGGFAVALLAGWTVALLPPVAASLCLSSLAGSAVGVLLAALFLTLCGAWWRPPEPQPPPRRRLSRGVVTVRPDGRFPEAAAILSQYAGCDLTAALR